MEESKHLGELKSGSEWKPRHPGSNIAVSKHNPMTKRQKLIIYEEAIIAKTHWEWNPLQATVSAFTNFVVISDVLMVDTERMSFRVELPLSEEIQFLVNEVWDRLNSQIGRAHV